MASLYFYFAEQKYHTARKQFKDLIGKSRKQQKLDATISSCFSG
jgi:hypothetical protein